MTLMTGLTAAAALNNQPGGSLLVTVHRPSRVPALPPYQWPSLQAAAEEAREDARALAAQLQTEEGSRASLASQLEVLFGDIAGCSLDNTAVSPLTTLLIAYAPPAIC